MEINKLDKLHKKQNSAIIYAILAAAFYALSSPISKILLVNISEIILASLLYLGAGLGMFIIVSFQKKFLKASSEVSLDRSELKYIIAMVVLDILAPILLLIGLKTTAASNVSLLNNFEIVATTLIAGLIFKEKVSKKLGLGIILVTFSTILISIQDKGSLSFSVGSLFVLLACISWGLENNCTRMLSNKDPKQIVIIKGFGSGLGALIIALSIGESFPELKYILIALLLGLISYGLSVYMYVLAQRYLGASKTSAYYAVAPFIGVGMSIVILNEVTGLIFWVALFIMLIGSYFTNKG
ncbi:MAG: DMT(drug/metabolite transporter) superfamily permease [Fusobacteria bacterium]|nr:MAG: DMT(drug/metabolite transporter) superfamily permease [Fusobacteriota bacterium]KAF0228707.1 MAG: DMT(drug/metabolite transporter) superfamily [Fusobacteriota bacterium]